MPQTDFPSQLRETSPSTTIAGLDYSEPLPTLTAANCPPTRAGQEIRIRVAVVNDGDETPDVAFYGHYADATQMRDPSTHVFRQSTAPDAGDGYGWAGLYDPDTGTFGEQIDVVVNNAEVADNDQIEVGYATLVFTPANDPARWPAGYTFIVALESVLEARRLVVPY